MTSARIRLAAAALLLLAWLGWLGYQALTLVATKPVVLSRPQFLSSTLDVFARVDALVGKDSRITVTGVHWPASAAQDLIGRKLEISNLGQCTKYWIGAGEYIVPLVESGRGEYMVAPIPRPPGLSDRDKLSTPRIYPRTSDTEKQLLTIRKPASSTAIK